jgi:hypothetical protein
VSFIHMCVTTSISALSLAATPLPLPSARPPAQNDLQAMARCHRIGQVNEVTVYRLVSRDTYEAQLFQTASRKYGLDEAILGFAGSGAFRL